MLAMRRVSIHPLPQLSPDHLTTMTRGYILVQGRSCVNALAKGDDCSSNPDYCESNVCRGRCCAQEVVGCATCDTSGRCNTCAANYTIQNGDCIGSDLAAGYPCHTNSECASQACGGGHCCSSDSNNTHASVCSKRGVIVECDGGFFAQDGECVPQLLPGSSCASEFECLTSKCESQECCAACEVAYCSECNCDGSCKACGDGYMFNLSAAEGTQECVSDGTDRVGTVCVTSDDCSGVCLGGRCCSRYK